MIVQRFVIGLSALWYLPFAIAAHAEESSPAGNVAAIERYFTTQGYQTKLKAVEPQRIVVESEAGDHERPDVLVEVTGSTESSVRVVLSKSAPPYQPPSARGKIAADAFSKRGCLFRPGLTRVMIDCSQSGLDVRHSLKPVLDWLAELQAVWQGVRVTQDQRLALVRSGDVRGLLTAEQSSDSPISSDLLRLGERLYAEGYFIVEAFAGTKGGQLTIASGPDEGLFLRLYVLQLTGGALYTVSFEPDLSFGGIAGEQIASNLDYYRERLEPGGCLNAFSPSGFCNSYLSTDYQGQVPEFDFRVRAFQGVPTLTMELEAVLPVYTAALRGSRLRKIADRLRPPVAVTGEGSGP